MSTSDDNYTPPKTQWQAMNERLVNLVAGWAGKKKKLEGYKK
jgi:hypothetical protein